MRVFRCDNCTQLLFFKNSVCLNCSSPLGFTPSDLELHALIDDRADLQRCANLFVAECNWIVEDPDEELCQSCRLTTKRPADDVRHDPARTMGDKPRFPAFRASTAWPSLPRPLG